jgi:tripartite-type tricarboxylate transporter receptor subunit TctC
MLTLRRVAALLFFSCVTPTYAQDFPSRSVRFIVPFAPSGGTDTFARIVAAKATEIWGQQMIVDNRAGAQGNIGTLLGARAPADGYTVTLAFVGTLAINPHIYTSTPMDPRKDFKAVIRGTTEPWVLTVNASFPAKDVKELIALAKGSPGKITFGSGSSGSQLAGELFKLAAGIDLLHIPYKGTAPAVLDLMAGNINLTSTVPVSVVQHIGTGRLRGIVVTGSNRIDMLPGVPTGVEMGMPEMNVLSWYGIVAPGGTPSAVIKKLNTDLMQVLNAKEVRDRMTAAGLTPSPSGADEFQKEIAKDYEIWGKVVKTLGLKPE